jgi:hypothetical protein
MDFKEFKDKYFTPENIAAYKASPDKMVFVSDLTWRSIDHSFVERLDLLFWYAVQDEESKSALANIKPRFVTITTIDAKFVKGTIGLYLDRRVECGPNGGKVTLWRRADRREPSYLVGYTPAGKWYKTQEKAIYCNE